MRTRILYMPVWLIRIAALAMVGSTLLGCAAREAPPAKSAEMAPDHEQVALEDSQRLSPASEAAPPEEQLSAATIQAVMRASYDQFRACYEAGLLRDPKLEGRVAVRFVIHKSGRIEAPELDSSNDGRWTSLKDPQVLECLLDAYKEIEFPPFSSGEMTVVYPIMFSPEPTPRSDGGASNP